MKEHPILFSEAMVRALLDGRKTQTRRLLKPQPTEPLQPYENVLSGEIVWGHPDGYGPAHGEIGYSDGTVRPMAVAKCKTWKPPAQVGDHLWVREQHRFALCAEPEGLHVTYAASPEEGRWLPHRPHGPITINRDRPSIHLPRWASRLTLEVCSVRVERVSEISEADARAEGVEPLPCAYVGRCNSSRCPRHGTDPYRLAFARLWDGLSAKRGYPFDAGCWVWCISFRVFPDPARAAG